MGDCMPLSPHNVYMCISTCWTRKSTQNWGWSLKMWVKTRKNIVFDHFWPILNNAYHFLCFGKSPEVVGMCNLTCWTRKSSQNWVVVTKNVGEKSKKHGFCHVFSIFQLYFEWPHPILSWFSCSARWDTGVRVGLVAVGSMEMCSGPAPSWWENKKTEKMDPKR